MAKATIQQIKELANTIALQADTLMLIPEQDRHARAKLILNNVQTLVEWAKPDA